MTAIRRSKDVSLEALKGLISNFEATTAINADGNVTFLTADHREVFYILPDAFSATPELSRPELRGIMRAAAISCRKEGPITEANLLFQANLLANAKLSQRPQSYSLWTKFRATQMSWNPGFSLRYRGVSLRTAAELPAYMNLDEYFISAFGDVVPREPVFFGHLIVRCTARNEEVAVGRMLDATQVFMGVVNILESYENWGWTAARRVADGRLLLGPYQFDFRGRRFLGKDRVWYNPEYDEGVWQAFAPDMKRILKLIPRVKRGLVQLEKHAFREVLERVIMLIQEGMGTTDSSFRLLRYWAALENLYSEAGARQRDYRKVIERAAFAEHDRAIARWKLGHISRLRNEYVHSGTSDHDLQTMSRYLRNLLARHLIYLIYHADYLRDHRHLLQLVDLPDDTAKLSAMKETIDRRLAIEQQGRDGRETFREQLAQARMQHQTR